MAKFTVLQCYHGRYCFINNYNALFSDAQVHCKKFLINECPCNFISCFSGLPVHN